jgi:hypothetical protein
MVLLSVAVASEMPSVWTDKNCACTKITEKSRHAVCWDPVLPVVAEGRSQPCTDRFCDPEHHKSLFKCDCEGKSFCEIKYIDQVSLFPIEKGLCSVNKNKVKSVQLVAEQSNSALESKPQRRSCLFTDTECTCGEHTEQSGCVDFVFDDPERGPMCKSRDCAPSMTCDCEGTSLCSKTTVTRSVWKATAHISSKHDLVDCRRGTHTVIQISRKPREKPEGR